MNRSELALWKKGDAWIKSKRFEQKASKLLNHFGAEPIIPEMLPVEISKRVKKVDGYCYYDKKIQIAYDHWKYASKNYLLDTLKHETLHQFIYVNHPQIRGQISFGKFEKEVYLVFDIDGSIHKAYRWKYSCECGWWRKTNSKLDKLRCNGCGKNLVNKAEHDRIKRIAGIKSKVYPIEIDKWGIFRKEKLSQF